MRGYVYGFLDDYEIGLWSAGILGFGFRPRLYIDR